jgi:tetratricopeptide (TPR) repeat protein
MGDVEYTFKHALTLEVGYNSVLTERRRLLHERAARAIEELYAEAPDDHLPELARHFDRGGNVAKAVEYQGRAGHRAAQQMAHSEAIAYLSRALELLIRLPDCVDRDRQEVNLQSALGWSLSVLNPTAPERERVLLRAQQLSEKLGDSSRLMEALLALGYLRNFCREYGVAGGLAQKVLALAEAPDARGMLVGAHSLLGICLNCRGELQSAREHLEFAVSALNAGPLQDFAQVTYVRAAAAVLPGTLFILGYPDAALRMNRDLLERRRLSDPVWIASNLLCATILHIHLGEGRTVQTRAEELLFIAKEHGMSFHATIAAFYRGWALAAEGRGQEGIAEMRTMPAGFGPITPYYALLAEAFGNDACYEKGLEEVSKGLREGERSDEKYCLSRLYSIQGELTLKRDPSDDGEAERCFRTAIDIARRQKARWWELRATVSLARLLKRQAKTEEAHVMLSEIYNWFTEGFDTADLKDAKALLDELRQSSER